ncbi:hypothetical protein C2857_000269 [Epichloe festucae Fl1]|uniref:Uncharacterized protein n=1 Tax=Epichloe festucae (strain Fl1) TaxID=877507 RepID=A0A7S9PTC7_EPIFF|nr:hypothetical protein C2857_000269 [Epichloe festucae Fl1]
MPPLEEVPSPVLILIAKSVPDLVSLHSLRLASPVCAALLSDVPIGAEIVDEVASLSMAKYNWDIFGYVWQLLQEAESTQTEPIGAIKIPTPHPTAESTLQLLALARVVHDTAHRCLHTLLRRLVALQPRRLIDITFDLRRQRFWKPSNPDFHTTAPATE